MICIYIIRFLSRTELTSGYLFIFKDGKKVHSGPIKMAGPSLFGIITLKNKNKNYHYKIKN